MLTVEGRQAANLLETPIASNCIETDRLLVRPFELRDIASYFRIFSEPSVVQFEDFQAVTLPEAENYIRDLIDVYRHGVWPAADYAVVERANSEVIGCVYIGYLLPDRSIATLGFHFHPNSQGRGYAFEACSAVLATLSALPGLSRFQTKVDSRNSRSIRLLERLGFRRVLPGDGGEQASSAVDLDYVLITAPAAHG